MTPFFSQKWRLHFLTKQLGCIFWEKMKSYVHGIFLLYTIIRTCTLPWLITVDVGPCVAGSLNRRILPYFCDDNMFTTVWLYRSFKNEVSIILKKRSSIFGKMMRFYEHGDFFLIISMFLHVIESGTCTCRFMCAGAFQQSDPAITFVVIVFLWSYKHIVVSKNGSSVTVSDPCPRYLLRTRASQQANSSILLWW